MNANPDPAQSSIYRLGEDEWIAVAALCCHAIGPGTFESVDAELHAHIITCPDSLTSLKWEAR